MDTPHKRPIMQGYDGDIVVAYLHFEQTVEPYVNVVCLGLMWLRWIEKWKMCIFVFFFMW